MTLSLCACGSGGNALDKSDTVGKRDASNYIGVWESSSLRLTISKGGVGNWTFLDVSDPGFPIKWEIKDGIMVVTKSIAGFEYYATFELDDSGNILNQIQKSGAFSGNVENDTEYVKVP